MSPVAITVAVIGGAVTLAGALITGLITLVLWFLNRGKVDAETDAQQAQAWGTLTGGQDTRIGRLESRLDLVETRLEHEQEQGRLARNYARTLAKALRDNGFEVPPAPDGLDLD